MGRVAIGESPTLLSGESRGGEGRGALYYKAKCHKVTDAENGDAHDKGDALQVGDAGGVGGVFASDAGGAGGEDEGGGGGSVV